MFPDRLGWLRLLQLADSALPIGAAAHSFGLETLAATGALQVDTLAEFFRAWLEEAGTLEAAWCLGAARISEADAWICLNRTIAAMKPARESRAASATLGRRFLDLAVEFTEDTQLANFAGCDATDCEVHLAAAFGAAGRALSMAPETVAAAFLHQSLAGLLSACQKLLPLGQRRAGALLWDLKPEIVSSVARAASDPLAACSFLPAVDIASMRHPALSTRLFVS